MRNAEARITLGVVAARAGDKEAAVTHGQRALIGARRSLPSLVMVGQELSGEFDLLTTDDTRASMSSGRPDRSSFALTASLIAVS